MPAHRVYYTKEECIKQYQESKNLTEFKAKHTAAYRCCVENGWEKEICHSFFEWDKPKNFEEAVERVKEYKDRSALWKSDHRMYYFLEKKGWLNLIPNLISKTDEKSKIHYIYVYEFNDYNTAYVGRTINIKQRHRQHISKKCVVSTFISKNKIVLDENYLPKILERGLTSSESQKKECEYIEKYKNDGWVLLNIAKGGSVGSLSRKWTKNVCEELSKQFKTKKEFREKYKNAYFAAMEHHWLEEYTWLENSKPTYINKYTFEYCQSIAKRFQKMSDFRREEKTIWGYSYDKGWLKDFKWLKKQEKVKTVLCYDCYGNFVNKKVNGVSNYERRVINEKKYFVYNLFYFYENEIIEKYGSIVKKIDLKDFLTEDKIKKYQEKFGKLS